jgi:transcriptional regulator with XRE-family HTH domain
MSERRDVTEEILDYLLGDAERPTFADLDATARAEAIAQLEAIEVALEDDDDMVPSFHDDPVAVRLGFRGGPDEARIYGPTVAVARRAAGLTHREFAAKVSATGHTIAANDVRDIEEGAWRTVTIDLAESIAGALEVEPRWLGDPAHRDNLLDRVGQAVTEAHDELSVTRFQDPFGDRFAHRFLVAFLDLRILLIVCGSDAERDTAIEFAIRSVADADRYAVIAAVDDDSELTTWPVRPSDVLDRYAAPDGTHTAPLEHPPVVPTSLSLAIGGLVEGEVVRWGSFGVDLREAVQTDTTELRARVGAEALRRIRSSAGKVASDRREAFGSIGDLELDNAQQLIDRVLAGDEPFDADSALDEVERVS